MNQELDKFHRYLELYGKLVKVNAGNFVREEYVEDVVQDTFLKMLEHLNYLEDDTVKAWLIVVSGNIAKDYLKKGGRYETCPMDPKEFEIQRQEMNESAEECFERAERQMAAWQLCRAACQLLYEKNPNWYYVMIDSYFLEMTSEQIGKVLNLSAGNVDVIRSRAKKYLRKELGKEYYDFL